MGYLNKTLQLKCHRLLIYTADGKHKDYL